MLKNLLIGSIACSAVVVIGVALENTLQQPKATQQTDQTAPKTSQATVIEPSSKIDRINDPAKKFENSSAVFKQVVCLSLDKGLPLEVVLLKADQGFAEGAPNMDESTRIAIVGSTVAEAIKEECPQHTEQLEQFKLKYSN